MYVYLGNSFQAKSDPAAQARSAAASKKPDSKSSPGEKKTSDKSEEKKDAKGSYVLKLVKSSYLIATVFQITNIEMNLMITEVDKKDAKEKERGRDSRHVSGRDRGRSHDHRSSGSASRRPSSKSATSHFVIQNFALTNLTMEPTLKFMFPTVNVWG